MALYQLFLVYLIDIMATSLRLTMYFVCRFGYYVLRNSMPFVCSMLNSVRFYGSPFDDTVQLPVTWLGIGGSGGTGMLGWFSDKEEVYRR